MNGARFIAVDDPVLCTEDILNIPPPDGAAEDRWVAMSAVERLAKMTNKTAEEVRDEMLKGKASVNPVTKQKQAVMTV